METLDCRGKPSHELVDAIVAHYDSMEPGTRFDVLTDSYEAHFQMRLLEAGARHKAEKDADNWRLVVERAPAPALTHAKGVHHVLASAGETVGACDRSHRVARIDGATGHVEVVAAVAKKISHFTVDAGGEWLYVADEGAHAMIAVNASDLSVAQSWPAPGRPQLPSVTGNGIVSVCGGAGTVTIARPSAGGFDVQTVEVGAAPHGVPVPSPDGEAVFVGCSGDGIVAKVRLADGAVLWRQPVGDGASHLAIHPDGTRVFSANSFDGTLTAISLDGDILAKAQSGSWAHVPVIADEGRLVYVANFLDDTLSVFDSETLARLAVLQTEPYPHGLDVSPDGRTVLATGFSSEFTRIYDAAGQSETARVRVGWGSSHSAFDASSATAFVGCSIDDHLAMVDLVSGALTAEIQFPA